MPGPRPLLLPIALAAATSGCVDRVITESICGDGRLGRGEVCLGQGLRSELSIDVVTPLALRTGDFDGDARPDLMVLGTDPSGVVAARLWRGDGEGGFTSPIDPGVFGCSAHPVPGTLDDDAITDLLVDDCGPSVYLFRGTESGVFEPPLTVFTGVATVGSGLFDIDEDGLREVVVLGVLDDGGMALTVTERDETGTFAAPVVNRIEGLGPDFEPNGYGLLDYDGDPFPDVLYVRGGSSEPFAIARGEAGLRFGPLAPLPNPGPPVSWATPRDVDGDGHVEVLVGSFDDEVLAVLDLDDGGALIERATSSAPGLEPGPLALADLDDDGTLDLLRARPGEAKLEAYLGSRAGRFSGPTVVDLDAPVDQLALVDLDEDGALDIVAGSFLEARVRVLLTDP